MRVMSFSIHLFIFLDSLICSFNASFIVPGTDLGAKNRKSTEIPAFQESAFIQKDRQIKYVNKMHSVLEDAEEDSSTANFLFLGSNNFFFNDFFFNDFFFFNKEFLVLS